MSTASSGRRLAFSRVERVCGGGVLPAWSLHRGRGGGGR